MVRGRNEEDQGPEAAHGMEEWRGWRNSCPSGAREQVAAAWLRAMGTPCTGNAQGMPRECPSMPGPKLMDCSPASTALFKPLTLNPCTCHLQLRSGCPTTSSPVAVEGPSLSYSWYHGGICVKSLL